MANEISDRCYAMGTTLCYDAPLGGYYVTPGTPGLFSFQTEKPVPGFESIVVQDLGQFTGLIKGITFAQPGVLL